MKNSTKTNPFVQSIIPLAMLAGCSLGTIVGIFLNPSFLVFTISIGTAIGFIIGIIINIFYKGKG